MSTIDDHVAETRRLVHDPNGDYWNAAFVENAVNKAIQERDKVTGGNRTLLTFTLTAGDGTYTFADLGATLGHTRICDVVSVTILFNGLRLILDQKSYTDLIAQELCMTNYRDVPRAMCRYGANTVIMGPLPSQAYSSEWDLAIFASGSLSGSDSDPLPYPYDEPVPYYAASLCKTNMRAWDEADGFMAEFYAMCSQIDGARVGILPTAYAGGRRYGG